MDFRALRLFQLRLHLIPRIGNLSRHDHENHANDQQKICWHPNQKGLAWVSKNQKNNQRKLFTFMTFWTIRYWKCQMSIKD